jgi:hypothetical protein
MLGRSHLLHAADASQLRRAPLELIERMRKRAPARVVALRQQAASFAAPELPIGPAPQNGPTDHGSLTAPEHLSGTEDGRGSRAVRSPTGAQSLLSAAES